MKTTSSELPAKLIAEVADAQARLEELRLQLIRERRKRMGWAAFAMALCVGVLAWALKADMPVLVIIAGACAALSLGAIAYYASKASSQYATAYKRDICGVMVRYFSPDMHYDEDGGIGSGAFTESGLFSSPDRYKTHDLVAGTYGKTKLRFARVHAEERHTQHTKNGTRTRYTTIFKGIFFIADFNKNFRGRTFVRTDIAERVLGNLGRILQQGSALLSSAKLVQLEDQEFEKEFSIYADDQVEARYILSPALMERMVALKKRCTTDVQFSFHGSSIAIAIPSSADLFTPDVSVPATDLAQLETVYRQFVFFLRIVDDLDLNTRIWSKE